MEVVVMLFERKIFIKDDVSKFKKMQSLFLSDQCPVRVWKLKKKPLLKIRNYHYWKITGLSYIPCIRNCISNRSMFNLHTQDLFS